MLPHLACTNDSCTQGNHSWMQWLWVCTVLQVWCEVLKLARAQRQWLLWVSELMELHRNVWWWHKLHSSATNVKRHYQSGLKKREIVSFGLSFCLYGLWWHTMITDNYFRSHGKWQKQFFVFKAFCFHAV